MDAVDQPLANVVVATPSITARVIASRDALIEGGQENRNYLRI
jgi:hypothetical protein